MSKIPAINEIDANSPSQESTEVVVKATTVTPDINEIQETISASATIQEIDGTRKPTISEIYKIVNDGLFESTTNWWDYAYKLSQAQLNQDIISRLDNGVIGGGYSKGVDIITTTSNKIPSNTNVYSALKSDSLYPKKLNDEVINGIYDFLNGLTIGKPTAYTGGTWSVDQIGKTHLTTDYLYVRLKAIFETLQILNVDTIGGKLVISPAGSIRVAYVDRIKIDAPVFIHNEETDVWSISQVEDAEGNFVNETLKQEVYRCYFLGEQDGEKIDNKWKVGDQAQAKTFNVKKGTYHKIENSYLWRLVVNVSSDTVNIDGKKYHYVDLSQIDFDSGSDAPAPGDILNQLGHRLNDTQRQTALVLNAVDNYAPSITLYAGINYYTLLNKEYVEFGVYNGKAFFNVYGDMYIGDKGDSPKTYIKYKNGKINIKANLEIGSSIGDKDLDQYIKENGGVDEETVKNLINNAQVIKDLQNQADGAIETWFYEGVPTLDNLPAIDWNTNELKKIHIGDLYYDQTTGYAYRFTKYNDDVNPYRWNRIKDNDIVAALEAANHAQATADGKMKVLYGETKPTNYQVGDMWVNATLEGKFNNDIARAVAKSESFNADDWVLASRYSEAIATIQKWTNEYETKFSNLVDEVKQQKDQSIIVWYLEYEPTVDNAPANTWNTETLRSEHIGDIVYDIKNNHSYRWTGTAWIQIKDADFNEAMKAAKAADDKAGAAGDLADSKRRIFYSDTTPTKPFDKGDLWIKQVNDKTETWVYNGTNWVKSEDKDLADFSTAVNEELSGIKGQLDGKAETWYQIDDPSTNWTDKASHEGDIWYNTTNGTTNYWNGSAWEQMDIPKDVFDTIDGKSSIFVDSYADAKAGTGVICKGYKERDLWILPEDATVNGVKYYKGDMLTAVSNNTNFDETNWKKKVRYVGQTELTNAIDIVNDKINTINNTTIPGINNKFNEFVKDGVLDSSEKARLTDLLNQASNEVAAVVDQVNNIITSKYLTNDNANKGKLEEANTVMNTAWTEYKNLINTLIAANTEITKVNIGEANTKYKNLQEKIKAVKQYLAICQADVLNGMGTDITSYKYLKEAFKGKTEINGGLVVTNVLQLRQTSDSSSPVTAGISGLQGKANADGVVDKDTYDITSIAAWFGGPMVDKDIFTDEQLNNKVAGTDYARSLFRHDGSGYLASGAIYWGTDGVLHGDPNSFILQGTSIATMLYYVRLFYLHTANQDTTDFNNIDYVTPMKTFSRLSVLPLGGVEDGNNLPTGLFIGDSNTGGSFQIGNVILRTKSGDPNILEIVSADSNKTAHLGVQGGVSAYGTYTSSTGGGGGLNATVVSYANIIAGNYNDTDLTTIPNAYSIKALYTAIQNIDVTSQLGNYLLKTDAADIYQPKGNYLTKHQTIYDLTIQKNGANIGTYNPKTKAATINVIVPTKISELSNDSGYTKNTGTVTSIGISVPIGLSVTNSPITAKGIISIAFAEGYSIPTVAKQTSWDGAVNAKHTHANKTVLDGISSSKVTNWDNVYNWYVLMTTNEETTDGIINKWNEVVNFLANIAQTDTLSGIIDGINTSISNEVSRAKKAEGTNASNISANKTSITTLQGYFTSGSAKKALQLTTARNLWGNAFNGTADVNGSIVLPSDKYISIGNIKLEYDATNKALKITNTTTNEVANLYTSGGVSAYGVGSVAGSGGGGLNGTIVPYSTAIASDPQNEGSKIASASSIYKLHSRISAIENNGATSITVTGTGNAITSVSKNGTSITFTKGATFLTSHQSLADYAKKSEIPSVGNGTIIINQAGSEKGRFTVNQSGSTTINLSDNNSTYRFSGIDFVSGNRDTGEHDANNITYNSHTYYRSNGPSTNLGASTDDGAIYSQAYRSDWVAQIAQDYRTGRLFVRGKNNNVWQNWKRIAQYEEIPTSLPANGGNADTVDGENASNFSYTHQTSFDFSKSKSGRIVTFDQSGTDYGWINGFASTHNNYLTSVIFNTHRTSNWYVGYIEANTSTGVTKGLTAVKQLAFLDSKVADSDKLDGIHANKLFTNISNSDKGISITVGGTTKSVSNISVNYASSAGNADLLDGLDWNSFFSRRFYTLDLSSYSLSNFYPLFFADSDIELDCEIHSDGGGWQVPYNQNRLHFQITSRGYADVGLSFHLLSQNNYDNNEITIGSIGIGTYQGGICIWVRGGRTYRVYSNREPLFKSSNYTYGDEIYSVGTNIWGGTNTNVNLVWKNDSTRKNALIATLTDNVASATKLTSSAGSAILPIYFSDGKPVACTMSTGNDAGIVRSFRRGTYTSANQYFGNGTIVTIDPKGTGCISANDTILSLGDSSIRNTQLLVAYDRDGVYYRRITDGLSYGNWKKLAFTTDNVVSATKLQTPRTIWGQSFDGTDNVDGTLRIRQTTSNYCEGIRIQNGDNTWATIILGATGDSGTNANAWSIHRKSDNNFAISRNSPDGLNGLVMTSVGMGLGTTAPAYRLDVRGDIYSSATIRTAAQNQAIVLSNNSSPAWISALEGQVIFNTGKPIRFGETAWDFNQWAGLKYTHSNKTIYLGIADGSAFNANSAQSDGTLRLAGIKTVTPDSGARIGGSGGDLYLGNASNSAWVKVQDMCSQESINNWRILQSGNAYFNTININDGAAINGATTINNNLSVNGLISNKGILPANHEFNNKGTNCYVSADALCSGITAITDSIQVNQVTVQYSNDNGNSWTNYPIGNDAKFNLYASNAGLNQLYLGYNVITGNNDTEKLAQIKKNELIVAFYISDNCYSQPYFASVDISNGVDTICTVEILNNSGTIVETYTKHMTGWSQINYISLLHDSNAGYGVGNNDRRYIRFKFKHDQKTTALRNAIINKIRIFSFTKYSFPTDRFMGHTGHIYNFDYNMNTYFPNSILAKGGVTAYQSSDVRLKTNITKLNCLNVIKSIGGTYEFDYIRDHKHSIGFIAQNVNNPLLNDIVAKDDNGYLKINYWNPKLISLAFGALTEIDDEVDKLKARVRELESEVEYLKNKDYVLCK